MKKSYTVVIRKEHCKKADYLSNHNCPLCNAIREQIPDFPLGLVGGSDITAVGVGEYLFNQKDWNETIMCEILSGHRKKCELTFTLEEQQSKEQEAKTERRKEDAKSSGDGSIKIIHHYVEVDRGIKEMEKTLN